jgi:hypothetical protein
MKIHICESPSDTTMLFISMSDGRDIVLGVDYRGLDCVTIMNWYLLPPIYDLRDGVAGLIIFTKSKLIGGENLIQIEPGDEWITTYHMRFGHYEYLVMPRWLPYGCWAIFDYRVLITED